MVGDRILERRAIMFADEISGAMRTLLMEVRSDESAKLVGGI